MGARFDISHINLVGYLTDGADARAPRTDVGTLRLFLMSLAYGERLISATQGSEEDWTVQVARRAERMLERLMHHEGLDRDDILDCAPYLAPLRPLFNTYDFFALILPGARWDVDLESFAFFKEAGSQSDANVLVLLPSQAAGDGLAEFVDPFPALRQLADRPVAPPGVMFWTRLGNACSLSLRAAKSFFRRELSGVPAGSPEAADAVIAHQAARGDVKRILHLSDLHFGSEEAERRKGYLKEHLLGMANEVDRIAVTGDLFDTPSPPFRASFDEFRRDVERHHGRRLLVVPGNHDMRTKGNALGRIGRNADQAVALAWAPVVIDHDRRMAFLSFNSSEGGSFARGRVDERQRLTVATEYDQAANLNPDIADYTKVALVHHHPVRYDSRPTTVYQRLLAFIGGEEHYIAFEGGDEFLLWCSRRGVPLVLHGHKHIPHLAIRRPVAESGFAEVKIVGCGSSMGAENTPMCYDVITIDPATNRSNVSYYHDDNGDGAGFRVQNVAVDLRPA